MSEARALTWFRACFAGLVLVDLGSRLASFHVFYTDAGLAPRWLAALAGSGELGWSLLYNAGSAPLVAAAFVVAALAALALGLGFHPRAAAWVTWAFLISFIHRVPHSAGPFELGLAALAFWLACSRGAWLLRVQALLLIAGTVARRGDDGSWLLALGCLPLFFSLSRPPPSALLGAALMAVAWLAPARLSAPLELAGLRPAPVERDAPPRWRGAAALPKLTAEAHTLDGARWRNLARALGRSEPLRLGLADYLCRAQHPIAQVELENDGQRFGPYRCLSADSRSGP